MKTYCKPLKRGSSWRSQNFGENATQYGPHSGNDEACNIGTPVHAAGDGVIEWAGEFDNSYQDNLLWLLDMGGNVAVLNCGSDEPSFVYAHMSSFYVRPGDRVVKGQVIGLSGNSGYATTGAHLHVEAIPPGYVLNSPLLGRVNPDLYLTEWPEDIEVEMSEEMANEISAVQAESIVQAVVDRVVEKLNNKLLIHPVQAESIAARSAVLTLENIPDVSADVVSAFKDKIEGLKIKVESE